MEHVGPLFMNIMFDRPGAAASRCSSGKDRDFLSIGESRSSLVISAMPEAFTLCNSSIVIRRGKKSAIVLKSAYDFVASRQSDRLRSLETKNRNERRDFFILVS